MESTLGAADLGSLRGDPGEAALGRGVPRVRKGRLQSAGQRVREHRIGPSSARLAKADDAQATQASVFLLLAEGRPGRRDIAKARGSPSRAEVVSQQEVLEAIRSG